MNANHLLLALIKLFLLYPAALLSNNKHLENRYESNRYRTERNITISGNFTKSRNHVDTLRFNFEKDLVDKYSFNSNRVYTVITDSNGDFTCKIPVESIGRLSLSIPEKETLFYDFIVQIGDNIHVDIRKKSGKNELSFSGMGSAKYICQKEIKSLIEEYSSYVNQARKTTGYYTLENIERNYTSIHSNLLLKKLKEFRSILNLTTYQLLELDIIGILRNYVMDDFLILYKKSEISNRKKIVALFFKAKKQIDTLESPFISKSESYVRFLYGRAATEIFLTTNIEMISIDDIYPILKSQYEGDIREAVLLFTLRMGDISKKANVQTDIWWNDAYELFKIPSYKQLAENYLRKTKGTKALDFSFTDSKGNLIQLNDFKGKVVLIDIWFTGCFSCLTYEKTLEQEVYPVFENNTEIVFLSICADKSRSTWLNSLRYGKYTRPENVNVFSNGLGFSHPYFIYYEFYGGPNSLLIDKKGNIYSGDPPKGDLKALAKLINEALNE